MNYKFALIGGDTRNIFLLEELIKNGHTVYKYGFDKKGLANDLTLEECIYVADYVICATPFTRDNTSLNTPLTKEKILIKDLLKLVPKDKLIFTGALTGKFKENEQLIDIYITNEVTRKSTIATVEGALKIAIENTNISINESQTLIIGYGKIGSYLAKILKELGSNVTVISRSSTSIKKAVDDGFNSYSNVDLDRNLHNKDIIFNTADSIQIDENNIDLIDENCVYIELASSPFGINYEDSVNSNLKVIYGLSLPGIVSPKTISKVIYSEIIKYIEEIKI